MNISTQLALAILVSALGYLVDIYDIMIFSVVRIDSLRSIGVADAALTSTGLHLLNCQLIGMLIGGLLWGILGDKRGRITVLFGSIFLYSMANLANAYVSTVGEYAFCRFFAGIGLAGELGAGVTLVSELIHTSRRGYGTMLVASVGVLGAILASFVGEHLRWQNCFILGGALGLMLLVIRIGVSESGIFQKVLATPSIKRGSLLQLFGNQSRLFRYMRCLFLGIPVWAFIGLATTIAPEIGKELHLPMPLTAAKALQYLNFGIMFGDILSSLLSQALGSRKKVVAIFMSCLAVFVAAFAFAPFSSARQVLWIYFLLGLGGGYWAVFLMISAEQFGTNLRATVATSIPNFVRAAVVPLSMIVQSLRPQVGLRVGLGVVVLMMIAAAGGSLAWIKETYAESLDFVEPY